MKSYDNVTTLIQTKVLCNRHLRPFDKFLIKNYNKELVGSEIGVLEGSHAFSMLNHVSIKTLYLIDYYKNYDGYKSYRGKLKGYSRMAKRKLSPFIKNGKAVFVKKMFQHALPYLPEKLDFVYYDISNNAHMLNEFFKLYFPLIVQGGVIGGWNFNAYHPNVSEVVINFTKNHDLKLDGLKDDWWIVK